MKERHDYVQQSLKTKDEHLEQNISSHAEE